MEGVLLQVLVGALLLGIGVSVFCRLARPRPALCHGLWLLVVVKLLVPPVFAWPWQPSADLWDKLVAPVVAEVPGMAPGSSTFGVDALAFPSDGAPEAQSDDEYFLVISDEGVNRRMVRVPLEATQKTPQSGEPSGLSAPAVKEVSGEAQWETRYVVGLGALGLWLGGGLVTIGVHAARIRRFRKAMRCSEPGPAWLVALVTRLSEMFGVRAPDVLVAEGLWSAMVWRVVKPVIVVPRRAVEEMEPGRWEGVVAHELAHLKRHDHWTAWLVLLASCVWWWNPLLWWARRRIADYAEMACDAWVLWALPERGREYADTLVHFVQAHSATPAVVPDPMPCMSCDRAMAFKRRLAAILRGPSPSRMGMVGALCIVALAAVVLPVFSQQEEGPAVVAGDEPERSRGSATLPTTEEGERSRGSATLPTSEPAPVPPQPAPVPPQPAPVPPQPAPVPPQAAPAEPQPAPEEPMPGMPLETRRRAAQTDPLVVGGPSGALNEALKSKVSLDFTDFHISDVAEFVSETYDVDIVLDWRVIRPPAKDTATAPSFSTALSASGGTAAGTPGGPGESSQPPAASQYVTDGMVPYLRMSNVPLGEALQVLTRVMNLVCVTYPNIVFITSMDRARADMNLPRPGIPPYESMGEVLSAEVSLEFTDFHIIEIIEFIAETYGVNIMPDWRVIAKPGAPLVGNKVTSGRMPKVMLSGVPLGEALDVLLRSVNLTFYPKANHIWVSSLTGEGGPGMAGAPGMPGIFPGVPRQPQKESPLPYFEVLGIFRPEDGTPIVFLKLPETKDEPAHNIQVPVGEVFERVRITGVLEDGKGIEVELLDNPGVRYKVGPPQQLFTPLPSSSATAGAWVGAAGGVGGGFGGGAVGGSGGSGGIGGGAVGGGAAGGFGGGFSGAAPGASGVPMYEVIGVFKPDGKDPVAHIRFQEKSGQPWRVIEVRLNETFNGLRFVDFLPDAKVIVVERVNEPGKQFFLGPAVLVPGLPPELP